jgi:hypothetical protein
MSSTILRQAAQGRQWVSRKRLSTFAGTCVSLTLAMPFARFYTRSLCDDMRSYKLKTQSNHAAARNGERMRICHQCVRDLKTWRKLTASEKLGQSMHPQAPDGIMHTDAADVGYGGTLGITGNPGDAGLWESQGVWGWKDRAQCISECELRAVPLLLQGRLGQKTRQAGMTMIRLYVDNTGVVAVTNAFVSSSPEIMRELRKCLWRSLRPSCARFPRREKVRI